MALELSEYRYRVNIDDPRVVSPDPQWEQSLRIVLAELGVHVPNEVGTNRLVDTLHGLLAPIEPNTLDAELVNRIEAISAGRSAHEISNVNGFKSVATVVGTSYPAADLVSIWIGDITHLGADVIVNAANQQMLGCRIPNHRCIDNAIHSAAGPRLRDDCATIMGAQREVEAVGSAKLTLAHALPASYVVHTVGPQLVPGSAPTSLEMSQLTACYRACLDVSSEIESIRSIAFCGISTGVFSFPQRPAAQIALTTIADWVAEHPGHFDTIVIDCFKPADAAVYREILSEW